MWGTTTATLTYCHAAGSAAPTCATTATADRSDIQWVNFGGTRPHDFRHSYAQRHVDNGTAPDELRDLLDHEDVRTTMGYYQVNDTRKRAAANLLAPLTYDHQALTIAGSTLRLARNGASIVGFSLLVPSPRGVSPNAALQMKTACRTVAER